MSERGQGDSTALLLHVAMFFSCCLTLGCCHSETKVFVYRNLVKALPWFIQVRTKLEDSRYWGFFLRKAAPTGGDATGQLYHDFEQTPRGDCGKGVECVRTTAGACHRCWQLPYTMLVWSSACGTCSGRVPVESQQWFHADRLLRERVHWWRPRDGKSLRRRIFYWCDLSHNNNVARFTSWF